MIEGQLEIGEQGEAEGYKHWQLYVCLESPMRLSGVKRIFGDKAHCEIVKHDSSAVEYVWKEETRVFGTQFELGNRPIRRNKASDWESIYDNAKRGRMGDIPADILVRHYGNISRIAADNAQPIPIVREVYVFCGRTGTGKSRRAWDEAGADAYAKDPKSKWWTGLSNKKHAVVDEFRGDIDIAHILRWTDRYPCLVETKGGSIPFLVEKIWFTSNLKPEQWYPNLDTETVAALMRRLKVTIFE